MNNEPNRIDLIRELREAMGLFSGAMPIAPKQAWEEAIAEVRRVREIAVNGYCWRCERVADAGEHDDAVADVIEDALAEDVILHYTGWAQRVLTALHDAGFEVLPTK